MSRADGTKAGPGAKRAGESGESGKAASERPESQERRGVRRGERARLGRGKIGEGLGNLSHSLSTADPSRPPSALALVRVQASAKPREESPASAPHDRPQTSEEWRQAMLMALANMGAFLQGYVCTMTHPSGYHLDAASVRAFQGLMCRLDLVVRNARIDKARQAADASAAVPAARLHLVHSRPHA